MKVFLSWSGLHSHGAAKAFYDWLPHVIQDVEPWLSTEDIQKGETWLASIKDAIATARGIGLFFVTREALSSAWLMFEAGGIAALDERRVCTICVDIEPRDVNPPLSFFQSTKLEKDDVYRLLLSLNALLPRPLQPSVLEKSFERTWQTLETALELAKVAVPERDKSEKKSAVPSDLSSVLDGIRRIESRIGVLEQQQRMALLPTANLGLLSGGNNRISDIGLRGSAYISPSSDPASPFAFDPPQLTQPSEARTEPRKKK